MPSATAVALVEAGKCINPPGKMEQDWRTTQFRFVLRNLVISSFESFGHLAKLEIPSAESLGNEQMTK